MNLLNTLSLLVLLAAVTPLRAQNPAAPAGPTLAADRAQVAQCLRQNPSVQGACIGSVAVACVGTTGVDRRAAEPACARREEAVWRDRLALALQATGRPLDSSRRNRLVALHLAWQGYVTQKCAFYGSAQAPALQQGRQAGCELREVALRTLELERVPPVSVQQRRPSQPPQIIR